MVADALVSGGAGPEVLEPLRADPDLPQQLLRALVFRLVSDHLLDPAAPARARDRYACAVELAVRLAG